MHTNQALLNHHDVPLARLQVILHQKRHHSPACTRDTSSLIKAQFTLSKLSQAQTASQSLLDKHVCNVFHGTTVTIHLEIQATQVDLQQILRSSTILSGLQSTTLFQITRKTRPITTACGRGRERRRINTKLTQKRPELLHDQQTLQGRETYNRV